MTQSYPVILTDKLAWAPEQVEKLAATGRCIDAMAFSPASRYYVCHHSSYEYGQAFGPLGFGQTLRFCWNLDDAMQKVGPGKAVFLSTKQGKEDDSTNASALIGAYMILKHFWSVETLKSKLPSEAAMSYPCAWAKDGNPSKRNMQVVHCWAGIELALQMGWLDRRCLEERSFIEMVTHGWRDALKTYNACWLVPGSVMVFSEPAIAMADKNSQTFKDLWPKDDGWVEDEHPGAGPRDVELQDQEKDFMDDGQHRAPNDYFARPDLPDEDGEAGMDVPDDHLPETPRETLQGGNMLMETTMDIHNVPDDAAVAQPNASANFLQTISEDKEMKLAPEHKPFFQWLGDAGVATVIRANFMQEPGMPGPSYDAERLRHLGFEQHDIQTKDGELPTGSQVQKVLEVCANSAPGSAVAFHCQGGFGRSVMLACLFAIERWDIRGDALLGWVRIVRPGSITRPVQEKLLCSLKGRRDVQKLMQADSKPIGPQRANQCSPCSIQ